MDIIKEWFSIASFKDLVEIVIGICMLIVTIFTYNIYKEQKDISRYTIKPQFVVDILQNKDYGLVDEITNSINNGEIPYQSLSVRNMGEFNASIIVEPYIAILNVKRTENSDEPSAVNIPIKVNSFFLTPHDLELNESNKEVHREQMYINYMRELSGAVTKAVGELNSEPVLKYRDGKTVQTEINYRYYVSISYTLDREKERKFNYYRVIPGKGSEEITASDYKKSTETANSIDMLDLKNDIYDIIKP